jgi:PadR family transcriptional regulator PadR
VKPSELDAWRAQLRKGAAELAVLACLGEKERYGVEILERIHEAGGLDLSEGSIYPLLARLQKEGKIAGHWVVDPDAAHPRKYYALTAEGRSLLAEMLTEWESFAAAMWQIIGVRIDK